MIVRIGKWVIIRKEFNYLHLDLILYNWEPGLSYGSKIGMLKFNVDVVAHAMERPVGIEVFLCNSKVTLLLTLSNSIGVGSPMKWRCWLF